MEQLIQWLSQTHPLLRLAGGISAILLPWAFIAGVILVIWKGDPKT